MMAIETALLIQYLALSLGVAGVVLSLSYPHYLANRLRQAMASIERKTQEVYATTANIEGAMMNMEMSMEKSMARTSAQIDELNTSIDNVHKRIDGISKSLIAAEYIVRKKNSKDIAGLTATVRNMDHKLSTLAKSDTELEVEISKLDKVALWAEKNVKELKHEVKYVKSRARTLNGHRRLNGNGKANGNRKHVYAKPSQQLYVAPIEQGELEKPKDATEPQDLKITVA